ncbi:MAG: NYN domain-containing protein [Candidatus Lokiarchaeota archaeon]|nr:NYN domain-containing protein [Candidatus Lokiarchaeota archaeon]
MSQNVIIFIDNSNIFHSFQSLNFQCDYYQLKEIIIGNRNLVEANLYTGIMYPVREKDKVWYSSLNKMGYTLKTRAIKVAPNGKKTEKRIDVLMAVDIISSAFEKNIDTIIIVSGDSDFVPVVKKLKDLNKKVEVWSFRKNLSQQLGGLLDPESIYYIDDILDQIRLL